LLGSVENLVRGIIEFCGISNHVGQLAVDNAGCGSRKGVLFE
jgi:hypothetical protein